MKHSLLAISLTAASFSPVAFAHSSDCNIDFKGNMRIADEIITITAKGSEQVIITPELNLLINGEVQDLNEQQYHWVGQYYTELNNAVPQTVEIATEGLKLAGSAIEQVLGELIGHDDSAVQDMVATFDQMAEEVQYKFYTADGSIYIDTQDWENGEMFDPQWEAEFEQAMEELVMQSMGKLMIAIGTEMLWSGGNMDAFEQRMENFASDVEHTVESQAEELEIKAEQLCQTLASADYAESKLQQISGLEHLDILQVSDYKHAM